MKFTCIFFTFLLFSYSWAQDTCKLWYHNQVYSAIIKKKQLKYIIIDNKKVGCVACIKTKHQLNYNLFFSWPSSSLIDEGYCKINLDSIWNKYINLELNLIPDEDTDEEDEHKHSNSALWYLIISSFIDNKNNDFLQ